MTQNNLLERLKAYTIQGYNDSFNNTINEAIERIESLEDASKRRMHRFSTNGRCSAHVEKLKDSSFVLSYSVNFFIEDEAETQFTYIKLSSLLSSPERAIVFWEDFHNANNS